jgi:hypothetical protein
MENVLKLKFDQLDDISMNSTIQKLTNSSELPKYVIVEGETNHKIYKRVKKKDK